MKTRVALLAVTTVLAALLVAPSAPSTADSAPAASSERAGGSRIVSREAVFDLANTNESPVLCLPAPDHRFHDVRGRIVGPAGAVRAKSGVTTINVLVHDAGTGGWFWNLRSHSAYDYATQLAKRGQTSLVLDRLGYDRSPLRNGDDTCLGAQVHMLHQVVQHLYAGRYDWSRGSGKVPNASHVVVHGHGTGATIARLEAAKFSDVSALVLMSPAASSTTGQLAACLRGGSYAPYGSSRAAFRRMLFASAPTAVQKVAARLRNSTPCGDVSSLAAALLAGQTQRVDVPVLVLTGSADDSASSSVSSSERVVRRTIKGAGNALVLEKQAPQVRRQVLRFVEGLPRTTR